MKFIGIVENSKFKPHTPTLFKQIFVGFEGKNIEVEVNEYHLPRSNPQNAYYWGVVVNLTTLAINDLGNEFTEEQTHDLFKQLFLSEKKTLANKGTGEVLIEKEFTKSTASLNTKEFEVYLSKCKQWCAETLDLEIPDPINFNKK